MKYAAIACVALAACVTSSEVMRLTRSTAKPIRVGRYEYPFDMIAGDHPAYASAGRLRSDAERHSQALEGFVRERLDVVPALEFRFMYAGLDSVRNRLILRYFAYHPKPTDIAGWQVQLVYRLPQARLDSVYVEALPLE